MALRPYEEIIGPLEFPYNGKVYSLPHVPFDASTKLTAILSGKDKTFAKKPVIELWKLALGPLYDEMVADNVPLALVARAGLTAVTDWKQGREVAEIAWETGGNPAAIEAYVAATLAAAKDPEPATA